MSEDLQPISTMSKYQPKIALVTGANRGIGLEIVRQLAQKRFHVLATVRGEAAADAMMAALGENADSVTPLQLEVTDPDQCAALVQHVGTHHGQLDVLVNNAGVAPDQWVSGFDLDIEVMREVMEVNLYAPLRLIQGFMPMMKSTGYGRIVNVSSELASLGTVELGKTLGYRTSKVALNGITRLLSLELQDYPDILVNAAAPGWVRTQLGGPDAPRSPKEGADTPVWLATLPTGGPTGGFYRDRESLPW